MKTNTTTTPAKPKRSARKAETVFHTLGYEQSQPEDYIRLLKRHGVTMVVDVRDFPISRKRGFSKNKLRELLAAEGIEYLHYQSLGAPKDLRDLLRGGGSWWSYLKAYNARVLDHRDEEIEELIELACEERISLLCYERNPGECHRSIVAHAMVERSNGHNLQVEHIRY